MAALPQQINLQQQPVDVGGGFADPMDPCTQCQMGNQELTAAMQQLTQICNACTTQQRLQQQTSGSCTECQAAQQSINQAQMQLNQMGGCSQCGQPMMTTGNQGVAFNPQVMAAGMPTTTTPTPTPTPTPTQPRIFINPNTGQPGTQPFFTPINPQTGQPTIASAGSFQPTIVAGPPVAPLGGGGKQPIQLAAPEGFIVQAGGIGPTVPGLTGSAPAFTVTPTTGGGLTVTPGVPPTLPAPAPAPAPVTVVTPTLTPAQIAAAQAVAAAAQPTVAVPNLMISGPPGGLITGGTGVLIGGFPSGVGVTGAFDSNRWLLDGLQAVDQIRNLL